MHVGLSLHPARHLLFSGFVVCVDLKSSHPDGCELRESASNKALSGAAWTAGRADGTVSPGACSPLGETMVAWGRQKH